MLALATTTKRAKLSDAQVAPDDLTGGRFVFFGRGVQVLGGAGDRRVCS